MGIEANTNNAPRERGESEPKNFEDIFAQLNIDLGYQFSELTGNNPESGIWKIQIQKLIESSQVEGNTQAVNNQELEGYVQLLTKALQQCDRKYLIQTHQSPSLHLTIEKM